jgi:hypothetical protein
MSRIGTRPVLKRQEGAVNLAVTPSKKQIREAAATRLPLQAREEVAAQQWLHWLVKHICHSRRPTLNILAATISLTLGEFDDEVCAKRAFGIPSPHKVQLAEVWVPRLHQWQQSEPSAYEDITQSWRCGTSRASAQLLARERNMQMTDASSSSLGAVVPVDLGSVCVVEPSPTPDGANGEEPCETREDVVNMIERRKTELAALYRRMHELPCDPKRPPALLRTLLANKEAAAASSGYVNVFSDARLHRRRVLGKPGSTLLSTAEALSEQLTHFLDGHRTALIGICHVDCMPDALPLYEEHQEWAAPRWACGACRPTGCTFHPCAKECCTAMLSWTDAVIVCQDAWDEDGHGILVCIPAPWTCLRMHDRSKRAQQGIDWAEGMCQGRDDATLKGIRRTSGAIQSWKSDAPGLERNQDIGLANDQGLACRDDWSQSAMPETFGRALAKGGSPEQLFAVPASLHAAGAAVDVQRVYAAHRRDAVARGGWALDAPRMPKMRIGPMVNSGRNLRIPAWRNDGIVDGTDAELTGAATFAATVHAGTEDIMCNFGALPFVHRLLHRQEILAFAEESLAMRAATVVERERLQRRACGDKPMSDNEELLLFTSRCAPFAHAKEFLLSMTSIGFGLPGTGIKGAHDDRNAARYATAHRTLTEPASGAKVALEICVSGKVIRVPSVRGQLVLWYAWLPHRTVQTQSSVKYATREKRPGYAVTPHERMHGSTYDRLRVERAIEVMEYGWKESAGQANANAMVTNVHAVECDSEEDPA